ncbi:dynein assembly factor 4, axonemal-like [Cephus cinctus]|uniref:Dynein assembly factor 4, axonemal-like n=1 Tax=Cephus cinctus TaxID=211228 RepID=A0AAJ7BJG3_CEPCN|nr:dynein assembly factor 4, axonemal-like [Cephus cinctus]
MPAIVVKDYSWRQTSNNLIIHAPLFGHPTKVDLFAFDSYVKASYPPFILELFLWGSILEEESICTLSEDQVIFTLKKQEKGLEWPSLVKEDIDRETKRQLRAGIIERSQDAIRERGKTKSEKRDYLQKQAVRAQIDLDTSTLNKIDAMRDSHRMEAMKDLEDWRSQSEEPILLGIEGRKQDNRKAYRPPLKWFKDEDGGVKRSISGQEEVLALPGCTNETHHAVSSEKLEMKKHSDDLEVGIEECNDHNVKRTEAIDRKSMNCQLQESICTLEDSDNISKDEDDHSHTQKRKNSLVEEMNEKSLNAFYKEKEKEYSRGSKELIERLLKGKPLRRGGIFCDAEKAIPLPRKSGTISVKFSERAFPTPARESHQLEEQEWLEKQAKARKQCGFVAEDLTPEEQDPQWLKDKGDEFFKAGNYLGAISAYSHGIKLSEHMSSLYVNRSAAHYALGNYYRCAEDSSKALELMVPHCNGNKESRARCHARRGAALCKLSAPQHGIPELEAALTLVPENESIKRDLMAAKQYFDLP